MKKRRLLAWLMTLVMMVGLMPATALAEESTATLTPDPVTVTRDGDALATLAKTAVDNGDGTYDVTLSVTASETIESQPVEIVLVLDSSGSMAWCTSDVEEHSHKNSCYSLTCEKDEHEHSGWDGCYENCRND
ncbi:MAG: hypothetical protein J6A71_05030, partial [Anaerotignum sp.]|nr:hypothetical protein [Anaerotignum sp.]